PPFTFTPPAPAAQMAFDVTRQGGAGVQVTVPFTVVDGCGPWQTFVGGGGQAWELPVNGQVVNAADGQPVIGATVQVQGTALSAATDGAGRFSIANIPKGSQTLRTSASGFVGETRIVAVGSASDPQVIGLHRDGIAA